MLRVCLPSPWFCVLALGTAPSCAPKAGPLLPGDAAVVEQFKQLHKPLYGVYDLGPDRNGIHGLLADSFVGEALTQEYVEHYTTLFRMVDDETSIQIQRVDYESVAVLDRGAGHVRVDADWSVGGVVTHQGHKHPRVNRYRAVYTLSHTRHGLRITDTRMRNLERVRSLLSAGDAWTIDDLPKSGAGFMDPLDLLEAGVLDDIEKAERERANTTGVPTP
ncbi:MAG: hypothetical protein CL927_00935 [Deltaproteobacteria bacterium]|nr:hypothetical protein [Deltaproteobacteria bacterium]HCH64091.1 hypothetical protein [Deltaproteobacteria bacterium]